MSSNPNPTLKSTKIIFPRPEGRGLNAAECVKVGITMGDPSGVGAAIALKALSELRGRAEFVVIGDRWVFEQCAVRSAQRTVKDVIDLKNVQHKGFKFGQVRAEYGRAAMEYLDKAMELWSQGQIDCLVTCPISKEAINLAGFNYSGHTEYFLEKSGSGFAVMMLLNRSLKFSLVTRHIPLKEVARISQEDIRKNISTVAHSLKRLFKIENPRLVVCGLNPHASDNGLIGDEENRIIKPALKKLKDIPARIAGPLSADTAIARALAGGYDCVIAMYHDQALIPLKLFGNDAGVNLTLGLPFVRTSCLHGTAFDIAANPKNINPGSLIAAVKTAIVCTQNLKKD
jgi:4-hydroxythreonine-4-phosphate dehydrogenase